MNLSKQINKEANKMNDQLATFIVLINAAAFAYMAIDSYINRNAPRKELIR